MAILTSSKYKDYQIETNDLGQVSTEIISRIVGESLPAFIEVEDATRALSNSDHAYSLWAQVYLPFAAKAKKDITLPDSAYWNEREYKSLDSVDEEVVETIYLDKDEALKTRTFIVMDVETTGLTDDDDVIQLSAVKFEDGVIVDEFDQFVKPREGKVISQLITDITGISESDVAGAPAFNQVWEEFQSFVGDEIWVGHNIVFDIRMLTQELKRMGEVLPAITAIDTLVVTKKVYPFWPSKGGTFKLENLKHRLKPELIEGLNSHNALDDSKMCGYWLLQMQEGV